MTNISRIEAHSSSTEAIAELSAGIEEACHLTNLEAVELMERYHALKHDAKVVDADGVAMTQAEYKKALEDLNAQLKDHLTRTGEPLTREGLPDLCLKPSSLTWYRLDAIIRERPEMFDFLVANGLIDVKASAKKLAETAPALMGLSKYAVSGSGTPRLEFERRTR